MTSVLQSYYAARAPEYDRGLFEAGTTAGSFVPSNNGCEERFSNARVLEVACGTGYWTRDLAAVAAFVTAADLTPETLAIAKRRVATTNVEFVIGDASMSPPGTRGSL